MSLAILCPGQGGQHAAMFDIVAGNPDAEAVIDMADRILPMPVRDVWGTRADIYRNAFAQPLICAAILARWRALERELPRPALVLGYSVGEVAAHAIAGTCSIGECLRLASRRATLMDEASPPNAGLIAVLGIGDRQIRALCDESRAEIAIENAAAHFVLGGPADVIDAVERIASARGARTVRLRVDAPSHTSWLRPAAQAFGAELAEALLHSPRLPILAGIDGHLVRDAADARSSLAVQIAQTVNWRRCIAHAVERGVTVFFELGPGNALARIVHESFPKVLARSLDDFRSRDGAIASVRRALEER